MHESYTFLWETVEEQCHEDRYSSCMFNGQKYTAFVALSSSPFPVFFFNVPWHTLSKNLGRDLTLRLEFYTFPKKSFIVQTPLSFLYRCFRLSSPALQALHPSKTHRAPNGAWHVHSQAERVGPGGGSRVPTSARIYRLCRLISRVWDRRAEHVSAQRAPPSREI